MILHPAFKAHRLCQRGWLSIKDRSQWGVQQAYMQLHWDRAEWKERWVLCVQCRPLLPMAPGTGSLTCCAISQGLNLFKGSVTSQEDKQHVLLRTRAGNISTFQTCTGKFICWLHVKNSQQVTFLQSKKGPNNISITLQTWVKSELNAATLQFTQITKNGIKLVCSPS